MKKMRQLVCLLVVGVLCMTAVPTFSEAPFRGEGIQTLGISDFIQNEY